MLKFGPLRVPDRKRLKFTEEQIIAILREQEACAKTAEVCRRHGISGATFYAWKAKFGSVEPSETKRLKALEDENAKLKRLLAEAIMDNTALKDLLSKSGNARREARGRRASRTGL
jgi:putative transposase